MYLTQYQNIIDLLLNIKDYRSTSMLTDKCSSIAANLRPLTLEVDNTKIKEAHQCLPTSVAALLRISDH